MSTIGSAQPVVSDAPRIKGRIERVEAGVAVGWVFDPARPNTAIDIDIRVGAETVGRGSADQFSTALQNAGFGDGRHGFRVPLTVPYQDGRAVALRLHDASTGDVIASRPYTVHCLNPEWIEPRELGTRTVRGVATVAANDATLNKPRALRDWSAPARKRGKRLWKRVRARTPLRGSSRSISTPGLNPIENAWLVDPVVETGTGFIGATEQVGHWPRLRLPTAERPEVSVIIPVHNQFHLTYQCLLSIVLAGDTTAFEVIVVDDRSNDATKQLETIIDNVRVVRNSKNIGFLHSCNKAANIAKGQYLLLLNNDTEVHPGWLDELRAVFDRFGDVGATGSKLIYPDGRLQDAGGIVWETGVPWNVGHGEDPNDPQYNYVRDVDYLTGAALMVARNAWNTVGGFSEEFAPAYYEDTDLAFKLRDAGFRTLYCPQSVVTHFEGGSHGTSLESGCKRYQLLNATTFTEKWRTSFAGRGVEGIFVHKEKDRGISFRLLMIDNAFPRIGEDAGSYAAMQEANLFRSLGGKVTFLPTNLLHLGNHVNELQRMGIECVYAPGSNSMDEFFASRGAEYDVVYITRYRVAEKILPVVRRHTRAKVIFNNADLHFLREFRQMATCRQLHRRQVAQTRERELKVMESVDAVLTYSDIERTVIASHLLCDASLHITPWVLPRRDRGKQLSERRGMCFLGGFAHPPNRDAVEWFLKYVMPDLRRQFPRETLHIWGSAIPKDCGWNNQPGVVVEGYAHSLDQVFAEARVFIAPLLFGAGIKGKVLDSVSYGIPAVLSAVAAESTGLQPGVTTEIAETPSEWTHRIGKLLLDDEHWEKMRTGILELRDARYSGDAARTTMAGILRAVVQLKI